MKHTKKTIPIGLAIAMDLIVITIYVLGFYQFYYLSPRELTSAEIKTVQSTSTERESQSTVTTAEADNEVVDNEAGDIEAGDNEADTTADTTIESLSEKFAEYFTDTVVSTDTTYTSPNISISVETFIEGSGDEQVTYYVADVYMADITCIQTGFAEDTYGVGYTDTVLDMDQASDAILAMNGDYYGNGGDGVVIRNGEVYRTSESDADVCVLYYDGTMKTFTAEEFDVNQAIADGAWQAWCFGPMLLDDTGSSMSEFTTNGHVSQINPRSAIGYYEPGHYCLIVVDGRQSGYSVGMTLTQFSALFEGLGCSAAYNMDGGKSSVMTFGDSEVNQPSDGGREVSDCIIIKEVS